MVNGLLSGWFSGFPELKRLPDFSVASVLIVCSGFTAAGTAPLFQRIPNYGFIPTLLQYESSTFLWILMIVFF